MKIKRARAFIQELYDEHIPEKYLSKYADGTLRADGSFTYSQCRGNHDVSGWEWDIDETPCYFRRMAAEILGLPTEFEVSPPRIKTPEEFAEWHESAQKYKKWEMAFFAKHNRKPYLQEIIWQNIFDSFKNDKPAQFIPIVIDGGQDEPQ